MTISAAGRTWPHVLASVVAGALLLLVLAMPKKDGVGGCISLVAIGPGLTYAHNCDSTHILRDARNPARYLGDRSPSRSRPVHIVAVAAVAHVLSPLLVPAAALVRRTSAATQELLPFYLAGVAVNACVLALSYVLLVRLIGAGADPMVSAALAAMLATYDVTVAWFWIPHQIMMNVLAPLGAVLAFVTGMRVLHLSWQALAVLGLVTALGALTYGYCLVWPLVFAVGGLWAQTIDGRFQLRRLAMALLIYGSAFVLPVVLWLGAFVVMGREIAYEAQTAGQFAWLGEAVGRGVVLLEIGTRAGRLVTATAGYLGFWGWLMIGLAAAAGVALGRRAPALRLASDPVVLGALVAAASMLTFNLLQGYHQARLLLFPLLLAQIVLLRLLVIAGMAAAVPLAAAAIALVQVAGQLLGPPTSME